MHEDLSTMHTKFKELISRFVDLFLGSFDVVSISKASECNYVKTQSSDEHYSSTSSNPASNNVSDHIHEPGRKGSNSLKHKGFVILMKDSAVSERSCFDELKATLKLGG